MKFDGLRCLSQNLQIPHGNPLFCHKHSALNHTFVMECCKSEDYCNAKLSPKLMPKPTGNYHETRSRDALTVSFLHRSFRLYYFSLLLLLLVSWRLSLQLFHTILMHYVRMHYVHIKHTFRHEQRSFTKRWQLRNLNHLICIVILQTNEM